MKPDLKRIEPESAGEDEDDTIEIPLKLNPPVYEQFKLHSIKQYTNKAR